MRHISLTGGIVVLLTVLGAIANLQGTYHVSAQSAHPTASPAPATEEELRSAGDTLTTEALLEAAEAEYAMVQEGQQDPDVAPDEIPAAALGSFKPNPSATWHDFFCIDGVLKEEKTLSQLSVEYGVHANVLRDWRAQALKGLPTVFERQNDITYIRLRGSWLYLVAILDWYSRYVISWALDDRLEIGFVLDAMDRALSLATPTIWNSDQGSHYALLWSATGRVKNVVPWGCGQLTPGLMRGRSPLPSSS